MICFAVLCVRSICTCIASVPLGVNGYQRTLTSCEPALVLVALRCHGGWASKGFLLWISLFVDLYLWIWELSNARRAADVLLWSGWVEFVCPCLSDEGWRSQSGVCSTCTLFYIHNLGRLIVIIAWVWCLFSVFWYLQVLPRWAWFWLRVFNAVLHWIWGINYFSLP